MAIKRQLIVGLFAVLAMAVSANAQESCKAEYGLVVDNSGGFRRLLDRVMNGAVSVVESQKAGERGFVVTFVGLDNIKVREELTENTDELRDAVENMYIEGGSTAIFDAVAKSIEHFGEAGSKEAEVCRSIILISDGDDRGSISKPDQVISLAKENNIRIFVVGMADGKMNTKPLEKLAKGTGGELVLARTPAESKSAFESVIEKIRLR